MGDTGDDYRGQHHYHTSETLSKTRRPDSYVENDSPDLKFRKAN